MRWLIVDRAISIFLCGFLFASMGAAEELALERVLESVETQYPPLLAAVIEQDIASGRVREAQGAFDPILTSSLTVRPANFYDGSFGEVLLEKPLENGGGSVYGGYRLSEGFLASYERKYRTGDLGEAVLGFKIPLLRDGTIDKRRAEQRKAAIDQELVKPLVLSQRLSILRSARLAYYSWLGAGKKWDVADQVLRIALERDALLAEQAKEGAIAPILLVDNQGLVVKRELAVLKAQREFEAASIALSLFYRDLVTGQPLIANREQVPSDFSALTPPDQLGYISDRRRASYFRPEVKVLELKVRKAELDRRLAINLRKPDLSFSFEINQAIGGERPSSDIENTEIESMLTFSIPIGQNEASGRLEAVDAYLVQLGQDIQIARDKIVADVDDSYSAIRTAYDTLQRFRLNVVLADQLQKGEQEKFHLGASDLLSLQLREQASFDARLVEIEGQLHYFKSLANYRAATASDAPVNLLGSNVSK